MNAVILGVATSSVFADNDRARAMRRLEAIDNLGARRLWDAMWPTEDVKDRPSMRLPRDHELKDPPAI